MIHLSGVSIGYFCGLLFDDVTSCRTLANMMMIVFMLSSGGFSNAATFAWFVAKLQYVSPIRYGIEIFYRRISAGYPN
jgi:ABC-type polysaccharide/polyol phosphate export permease